MRRRHPRSWQSKAMTRSRPRRASQESPSWIPTAGRQLIAAVADYLPNQQRDSSEASDCYETHAHRSAVRTSISNPRMELKDAIRFAYHECAAPHWDGDKAEAVLPVTVDAANRLIDSLPVDVPLPTVTPEPDGQLNFEWYREPRKLLSVSVSATGTLYWAALIGSEDPRGSIQFSGQFPKTLLYWISQVYE